MRHVIATAILCLSSLAAFAQDDAQLKAKETFCKQRAETTSVQQILMSTQSHLTFSNQGGLFNGGVCWWHSRFTRNAAYLVQFRPDLEKPTQAEAKKLVQAIRRAKAIVIIPGYANLQAFSYDWDDMILDELEAWQKKDGFVRQQWIRGLRGRPEVKPEVMERQMNQLFQRVQAGEVVYQKLQMPGVTAHAWLVVGMEATQDGYVLTVIDSNAHGPSQYYYRRGMTEMSYYYYYSFVPYTEQTKEEGKLKRIVNQECSSTATEIAQLDVEDGSAEEDEN